jgi:hypothetical protein
MTQEISAAGDVAEVHEALRLRFCGFVIFTVASRKAAPAPNFSVDARHVMNRFAVLTMTWLFPAGTNAVDSGLAVHGFRASWFRSGT